MRFRLVIFDFDGTLADTRADIVDAVNAALVDLAQPRRDAEEVAGFIGRGVGHLMTRALPDGRDDLLDEALSRFRHHYDRFYDRKTRLYPDVPAVLHRLSASGRVLTVASNKPTRYLDLLLEQFSLTGLFRRVIGGDDMHRKKPDPWCVEELLSFTGSPPDKAMIVGDMRYDIETGSRAGIHTCGVTYGFGSEAELRAAGARTLIPAFSHLEDLV